MGPVHVPRARSTFHVRRILFDFCDRICVLKSNSVQLTQWRNYVFLRRKSANNKCVEDIQKTNPLPHLGLYCDVSNLRASNLMVIDHSTVSGGLTSIVGKRCCSSKFPGMRTLFIIWVIASWGNRVLVSLRTHHLACVTIRMRTIGYLFIEQGN
jgi:hypothetical protein